MVWPLPTCLKSSLLWSLWLLLFLANSKLSSYYSVSGKLSLRPSQGLIIQDSSQLSPCSSGLGLLLSTFHSLTLLRFFSEPIIIWNYMISLFIYSLPHPLECKLLWRSELDLKYYISRPRVEADKHLSDNQNSWWPNYQFHCMYWNNKKQSCTDSLQ